MPIQVLLVEDGAGDIRLTRQAFREIGKPIQLHLAALKIIPTIIPTTSDDEADVQISHQLQANCYLRKPAQCDASDGLVRSINPFWLTRAKLPQPKSSTRG